MKRKERNVGGIRVTNAVPMPRRNESGRRRKYPWLELEIGDSFLLDLQQHSAYAVAKNAGQRYGRRFIAAKTPEGMRVWRAE